MRAEEDPNAQRWRREAGEQEVHAVREREKRARTERVVTQDWDAYVRSIVAQEREFLLEVMGQALRDTVGDLWSDIEREVSRAIKLSFLERGGWQPRICGTHDESRSYAALDIVARDGVIWLAKHSDPGPCPGAGWQLVSQKGERGRIGPIGPRGEPGPPGPKGEPGCPRIAAWIVDATKYTATPIGHDGLAGAPLQLRALFSRFNDEVRGVVTLDKDKATEAPRREPAPLVQIVQGRPPESEEVG